MNIYTKNGYTSRRDYHINLAADYGVELQAVLLLAMLLGPEEDFDALVTHIQDLSEEML